MSFTTSLTFYEGLLYSKFNTKKIAQTSINTGEEEWTSFVGVDHVLAFLYRTEVGCVVDVWKETCYTIFNL
jgi:hypothetical protein